MISTLTQPSAAAGPVPRFADPEVGYLDDIVDTDRYPVADVDGRAQLVADARRELGGDGCLVLDGFIRPSALATARDEVAALAAKTDIRPWTSSVYARTRWEAELDIDDPRRRSFDNLLGQVTRDQIGPDTIVARLYASPIFKSFIAECVGEARLFEYADPLAGLIATIIPPGGCKAWHYDTNEYTVTVMTQQPDDGGEFVYFPGLRRPGDEKRRACTAFPLRADTR